MIPAAAGVGVVVCVVAALGLVARALPPGGLREAVGFIPNCVVLLRAARADRRVSKRGRLVLAAALAYVVSPVQLIPNFIPVIGQLDDVVVVTGALRYACRRLPPDVLESAWRGDPATLRRLLGIRVSKASEKRP